MYRIILCCIAFAALGCTPRLRVIHNPTSADRGIRYYRPKPYLLITPATEESPGPGRNALARRASDEAVNLELRYLPDFTEEYALDVRPGLGSANVSIELEDGWNLVSLNQELDSQFDENLSSVADVIKAIPTPSSGTPSESATERFTVRSSNVPLGFYESVIGRDDCGRKQMYGWRYVGFVPYGPCPVCPTGQDSAYCGDGTLALYGLVFQEGVMVFKAIGEIAMNEAPSARVAVRVGTNQSSRRTTMTTTEENGEVTKTVTEIEIERLPVP